MQKSSWCSFWLRSVSSECSEGYSSSEHKTLIDLRNVEPRLIFQVNMQNEASHMTFSVRERNSRILYRLVTV